MPAEPRDLPWGSLILLAGTGFVAVATETLPVGLLPVMARDYAVSETRIGALVSIYAAAVVIASVPLNAWTSRWPRRSLLMALVGVYGLSNLALIATVSFPVAAAARLVGGLAHALFFSILFGYVTPLVPRRRLGTAMATVGAGNGLALGVGVPLGTLLGTAFGWRVTFGAVAVLCGVLVLLVRRLLPPMAGSDVGGGRQLRDVLERPTFRWLELATLLTVAGVFASYTYLSPVLIEFGYRIDDVGAGLLVYGLAALASLFAFGRLADRGLRTVLPVELALLVAVFLLLALLPHSVAAGTVLVVGWGLVAGTLTAYIQTAVISVAGPHTATASAVHNSVFNVGIGVGALLGGQILLIAPAPTIGFASALAVAAGLPIWRRWLQPGH